MFFFRANIPTTKSQTGIIPSTNGVLLGLRALKINTYVNIYVNNSTSLKLVKNIYLIILVYLLYFFTLEY